VIVHIALWNLADSKTTVAELREHLPEVERPSAWISDESSERFGLVAFGGLPDLTLVRELIGKDPEIGEEFDVEES
jgi:hypothetical protein